MKYKNFEQFINEASIPRTDHNERFVQPFRTVAEAYEWINREYNNYVNFCNEIIRKAAKNRATLAIRIKRQETLIEKLKRKGKPLNQIMDILAGTIVTENQEIADQVAKYIWNRHRDQIFSFETKISNESPDRTGYSGNSGAYHLNLNLNGLGVEILIMSKKTSELKRVAHKIYKVQRQGGEADPSQLSLVAKKFKRIRQCQQNPEQCSKNKKKERLKFASRSNATFENFHSFLENEELERQAKAKFANSRDEELLPLPEKYNLYFNIDDETKLIPLKNLVPIRSVQRSIRSALIYMHASSLGEMPKRDPISVKSIENGMYEIQDGNSTFNIAQRSNWKFIPVKVIS